MVEKQTSAKIVHLGHALTSQRRLPLERYVTRGGVFYTSCLLLSRPAQGRDGAGKGVNMYQMLVGSRPL